MLPKSEPIIWKPTVAEPSRLLETACEVSALSLKSGAGSAHVSLYDAKDISGTTPNALKWTLDCSTTDNDNQSFDSPLIFRKGLFAICDNGLDFNAEVCAGVLRYN